jgi:hypothetical protein
MSLIEADEFPLTIMILVCPGDANGLSTVIMASSNCAYTSEEALLNHPYFNSNSPHNLYKVIARSLASCKQVKPMLKMASASHSPLPKCNSFLRIIVITQNLCLLIDSRS